MNQRFEAQDDPDINHVWAWFEYQVALIAESRASVLRAVSSAPHPTEHSLRSHEVRFIGCTAGEVEEFFDAQRGQLELVTMFEILATTEAILRMEVKTRIAARKRDSLSKRFRRLYKVKGDRIRLHEDILVAMKEEGVSPTAVAAFRAALNLRHWLAHGRHWHPKLGRGYAPTDVFDIARDLIDTIPRT